MLVSDLCSTNQGMIVPDEQQQTANPSPQRRPPEAGDPAPYIASVDQNGEPTHSYADWVAGHPALLLFCPTGGGTLPAALLGACRDRQAGFAALGCTLFAISRLPAAANRTGHGELRLPFKILADGTGQIFGTYGALAATEAGDAVVVALDPGHRVARRWQGPPDAALVEAALAYLTQAFAPRRETTAGHAPVLVLPRVLSHGECAKLVQAWHRPVAEWVSTDGFTSAGHAAEAGDFRVAHDGAYGRMTEYVVREAELQTWLDRRFARRVAPEMTKAFQTSVSQREVWRIVRYDATKGDGVGPHRDNNTERTRHRRFTMTINLNAGEYEGGALRFAEYGGQLYEVERGTAVVWSAALLHEVTSVTSGFRFVLGVHMHGA